MPQVRRKLGVRTDIIELAEYISRDNLEAGVRLLGAVEATLVGLAEMPGKGSLREFDHPKLSELRSYPVQGFPNHLIFYEVLTDGILVVAVLHGARDLPRILRDRQ